MLATKRASVTAAVILLIAVASVMAAGAKVGKLGEAPTAGAAVVELNSVQCEDSTSEDAQKNLWCCISGGAVIDVTPPIISNIKNTSITDSGATVQWGTDEDSTSIVNYGTTSGSLGSEASSQGATQTHSVSLSGLSADTTYYFNVTSCDANNNCKTSDEISFKTSAAPPPPQQLAITDTKADSITKDSATIIWTTNKNSNSTVSYSIGLLLDQKVEDAQQVTSHSIQLSGLQADTTYYYKAKSCDASECVSSGTLSFKTSAAAPPGGDVTPPVISGVENKSITKGSAVIAWTTNELADSLVKYGTTSGSLNLQASSGTKVFSHSTQLSSLAQGIQYYYTTTSCDVSGNCATSNEFNFKTLACTDADGDSYYLEGGACGNLDCNDGNANLNVETTFYADLDNDKFGNLTNTRTACAQPPGYVTDKRDCSDSKANINPNATEVCDGLDNNCNGQRDENALPIYYEDNDKDGFGNATKSVTLQTCSAAPPAGYVSNNLDCDDMRNKVTINTYYRDADSDTFGDAKATKQACELPEGYVSDDKDCNDAIADVNPNEAEICNALDDNCDSKVDEAFDVDNDKFFNKTFCASVAAYANKLDFNDNSAAAYPGAKEVCDAIDNEGNSIIDDIKNSTNKTITKCACTGLDTAAISAQKTKNEDVNGLDDNCDGALLKEEEDADNDGFGIFQGDCNDASQSVNPKANEICTDKIDNNCNGKTDDESEGCTTSSGNIAQGTGSGGGSRGEEPSTANATAVEQPATVSATQAVFQGVKGDEIVLDAGLEEAPKKKFSLYLVIPVPIILALISLVYMLYIRPKQQLGSLSEQHGIGPDASLGDAQAFVNSGIAAGLPSEQIQGHLEDQGVPQAKIEQAIRLTAGDMKDLDDLAKKREVGYTREYEEGEKYVSECLDKGYAPVQVKAALLKAGWPKATVEKLIGLEVSGDLRKIAKQFGVDKPSADAEAVQGFTKAAIRAGHTQEAVKKVLQEFGK